MCDNVCKMYWTFHESKPNVYTKATSMELIPHAILHEMSKQGLFAISGLVAGAHDRATVLIPVEATAHNRIIGVTAEAITCSSVNDSTDDYDEFPDPNVESIEICSGIKFIADFAFAGNESIKEVVLPPTLLYLGAYSLECNMLQSIDVPSSVRYIGEGAFYSCKILQRCVIPHGVQKILSKTFAQCYSLSAVYLPATLTGIASEAFAESGLRYISIPEGVQYIESRAFAECESLFSVSLPRSTNSIADDAFDPPEINPLLTFYVYPGSYGLMWAREHGYKVASAEI